MSAKGVEDVWAPWEGVIDSWESAVRQVQKLATLAADKTLVWRGVVDSTWPIHSSLRRRVAQLTGEDPGETLLQRYEREILQRCRGNWRYDNMPAMEILAHLQHFGGPTRLIDVTLNPLVALWFAVEQKYDERGRPVDSGDGRLFAFAVRERITLGSHLGMDWGGRELPWSGLEAKDGWGRWDTPPVLWVPPAYNERISAQNAGFLIGGTPASWKNGNRWKAQPGATRSLGIREVRAASSLYVRPAAVDRSTQLDSYPVYNFRITSRAKAEIKQALELQYGYKTPTLYPDLFAMAAEVLKTRL